MAKIKLSTSQLQRFLSVNRDFLNFFMGKRADLEEAIRIAKTNPYGFPSDVQKKVMDNLYKERRHLSGIYTRAAAQQRSVRLVLWERTPMTHALAQSMQKTVTPILFQLESVRLQVKKAVHTIYAEQSGREKFNEVNGSLTRLNEMCFNFIQMQRELRQIAGGQSAKVKKIGTKHVAKN